MKLLWTKLFGRGGKRAERQGEKDLELDGPQRVVSKLPGQLSIVIPAYNERIRLPPYLREVRDYCEQHYPGNYEVIVVDDGSCDGMHEWLTEQAAAWPALRVLRHARNRGKGAAVRMGVAASSADRILFTDADGATPISEEIFLQQKLLAGADVAVGNRFGSRLCPERAWTRRLQSGMFSRLARWILGLDVFDTQCGFKMLTRPVAVALFPRLRERGFLLDVELLATARAAGYVISECAVRWRDVEGSKVRPLVDAWKMGVGLWRVRRRIRSLRRGPRSHDSDSGPPERWKQYGGSIRGRSAA